MRNGKENLGKEFIEAISVVVRHRPGRDIIGKIEDTFRAVGLENYKQETPKLIDWDLRKEKYLWRKKIGTKELHIKKPFYLNDGSNVFSLVWRLPLGIRYADVLAKKDYFADAIGGFCSIEQRKNGEIIMQLTLGSVPEHKGFNFNPADYPGLALPLPVGWGAAGLIVVDLAKLPHIRVGGTTFSGKSNLLHNWAISLLMNEQVILFVIDLALLEFSYLKKHTVFASSTPAAVKVLRYLEWEMHRRLVYLDDHGVNKIQDYRGNDLPYLVLMVDEYSFLAPSKTASKEEKELRSEAHFLSSNLAALARKVGIHLIIAMQRPDMNIMPGDLKANFPAAVSFKTIDDVNSQIILDNSAAANLPNIPGRAIWQVGIKQDEVQVMELPLKKAKELIKDLPRREYHKYDEYAGKRLLPR